MTSVKLFEKVKATQNWIWRPCYYADTVKIVDSFQYLRNPARKFLFKVNSKEFSGTSIDIGPVSLL